MLLLVAVSTSTAVTQIPVTAMAATQSTDVYVVKDGGDSAYATGLGDRDEVEVRKDVKRPSAQNRASQSYQVQEDAPVDNAENGESLASANQAEVPQDDGQAAQAGSNTSAPSKAQGTSGSQSSGTKTQSGKSTSSSPATSSKAENPAEDNYQLKKATEVTGTGSLRLVYDKERFADEFSGGKFDLTVKQDLKKAKEGSTSGPDASKDTEYEMLYKSGDKIKETAPSDKYDQTITDIPSRKDAADGKPESADINDPVGGITYDLTCHVNITPLKDLIDKAPKDSDTADVHTAWLKNVQHWASANKQSNIAKLAEDALKESDTDKVNTACKNVLTKLSLLKTQNTSTYASAWLERAPKDTDTEDVYKAWFTEVEQWSQATSNKEIEDVAADGLKNSANADTRKKDKNDLVVKLTALSKKDIVDDQVDNASVLINEKTTQDVDLGDVTVFDGKTSIYYIGTDVLGENVEKAEPMEDFKNQKGVDVTFKNVIAVDSIDFIPSEYFLNNGKLYKKAVNLKTEDQKPGEKVTPTEDPEGVTNIVHVKVNKDDVKDGRFVASDIPVGKYVIRVNKDAENGNSRQYYINDSKEVEINETNNTFNSEAKQQVLTVKAVGNVLIGIKNGVFQWEKKPLQGVVYEVRADEDITGTVYNEHKETDSTGDATTDKHGEQIVTDNTKTGVVYHKDDLIETITTDENGVAKTTKNLYNGKYYVVEKSVPGYLKTKGEIQNELDRHTAEESNARKDQSNDIGDDTKNKNSKSSDDKLSPASFQEDKDYFIRSYQVGTDIPAGTYTVRIGNPGQPGYYYVFNGKTDYHDIQKMHDAVKDSDAVLDYEKTQVKVQDGQTLVLKNAKITNVESQTKDNAKGEEEETASADRRAFTVDPDHYMEFVAKEDSDQDQVEVNFDYDSESTDLTLKKSDDMPNVKMALKANFDIYTPDDLDSTGKPKKDAKPIVKAGDTINTYSVDGKDNTVVKGLPNAEYSPEGLAEQKDKKNDATPLYHLEYAEKPYGYTVKPGTTYPVSTKEGSATVTIKPDEKNVVKEKNYVIEIDSEGKRLTAIDKGKFTFSDKPLKGVSYDVLLTKDSSYVDSDGTTKEVKAGTVGTLVTNDDGKAYTGDLDDVKEDTKEDNKKEDEASSKSDKAESEASSTESSAESDTLSLKSESESTSTENSVSADSLAVKTKDGDTIPLHGLTDYSVKENADSAEALGVVADNTEKNADFDKDTGVATLDFKDHKAKTIQITVKALGTGAEGASVGLYANTDIYDADGKVLAKKDTKLSSESITSGSAKFSDLPTRAYVQGNDDMYYVKVDSAPKGTTLDGKKYNVRGDKDAEISVSVPAAVQKTSTGNKGMNINIKPNGRSSMRPLGSTGSGIPDGTRSGVVRTGDTTHVGVFAILAAIAAAVLVFFGIKKKKGKKAAENAAGADASKEADKKE